jgi:hypothetical protein
VVIAYVIAQGTLESVDSIRSSEDVKENSNSTMFRFTIRDVLWLTIVAALCVAWRIDRQALKTSEINRTDAERKVDFLLMVLRQDGYDVDAPQGHKGPISLPSHYDIMADRDEGHIRPPAQ